MSKPLSPGIDLLSDRFSTYVLPGRAEDPTVAVQQARDAQAIGLGGVWLAERYAIKEPGIHCGALAQAAPGLKIGGTFHCHMRHPLVTASAANLMQAYTGNRFILVLARAVPAHWKAMGMPVLTLERTREFIHIARRLWAGETVSHSGTLGEFVNLRLTDRYDAPPPPIVLPAMGPRALAFAGEHADGVLLHGLLTTDGVRRSMAIVRAAAERAERDPSEVRIIANVVVAPDLPPAEEAAVVGGRAITYLQIPAFGEQIVNFNQWDPAVLERIRNHPLFAGLRGRLADQAFTKETLVKVAGEIPDFWLREGNAMGTPRQCAVRLKAYLDLGCDEILLHGSQPGQMAEMMNEMRKLLEP
ncbi:MAG: TIGR03857 family LLM class F420-dependent oxidoreductase [Pseudomonadota bacterium]|nr:TIGR03857 family LLM class F420-dependent oxidoreductase [Pseudomonadota bacterium]